jgi:hypothetical protein
VREQLLRLRGLAFHQAIPVLLTDVVLLGFAAFTVVSQLTAMVGGTPRVLMPALLAIAVISFGLLWYVFARNPAWFQRYVAEAGAVPETRTVPLDLRTSAVIGASVLAMLLCALVAGPRLAWVPCAALMAWLAYRALRAEPLPGATASAEPWWAVAIIYACGLVAVALALLVVRPRSDDAFYLSMALSVFDAPDRPLLAVNTIHGPPGALLGVQRMFPPYRVHSFEVFGGALSQLTRIDPAFMFHLLLAPLLSFIAPFAIARALRMLTPAWWVGLCAVVAFHCIEGTASVGFANHAFVRMFHGKSVLLTAGLPLMIVHGLRFGQRPGRARFMFLLAAQIAAVGLSSTAIWLAPVVSLVAVLAGTPERKLLVRRALGAVASSAYVLALGLWVFAALSAANREAAAMAVPVDAPSQSTAAVTSDARAGVGAASRAAAQRSAPALAAAPARAADAQKLAESRLQEAVGTTLGPGRTAFGLLAVFALALGLTRVLQTFRALAWLGLCAAALATPPVADWVAGYLIGASTYHRLFWLLPIPLCFGIVAGELFAAQRERPRAAAALAFGAVAVLLAVCTQRLVLSESNNVRLVYPPALKIGPRARGAARAVCEHLQHGEYVLASSSVSEQVATIRRCGHPLLTVARWMNAPAEEIAQREELARYVSTHDDVPVERAQWFLQALARYRPKVVVMLEEAMKNRRTKLLLRWAGYEKVTQAEGNHVWVGISAWRKSEHERVALDTCQKTPPGTVVLAPFGVSHAIRQRGCAKTLFEAGMSYDARLDAIAQFERMLTSQSELSPEEAAALRALLAREHVGVVVVAPQGMGNGDLRVLLRDLDYRNLRGKGGHRVFVAKAAP